MFADQSRQVFLGLGLGGFLYKNLPLLRRGLNRLANTLAQDSPYQNIWIQRQRLLGTPLLLAC